MTARHQFKGRLTIYQWWLERWDDRCVECGSTRRHSVHQGLPAWTPEDEANLTRRVKRLAAKP